MKEIKWIQLISSAVAGACLISESIVTPLKYGSHMSVDDLVVSGVFATFGLVSIIFTAVIICSKLEAPDGE
jgi:hypothetical protein